MTALTRLEKELIFSHFSNEKPSLHLKVLSEGMGFLQEEYSKKEETITFRNENLIFFDGSPIKIYFFYKKLKICLTSTLEVDEVNNVSFKIPNDVYIKKKKKKHRSIYPSLNLYYQNLLLSTFLSVDINNFYKASNKEQDIKVMFARSHTMGHNLEYLLSAIRRATPTNENLYSHLHIINNFLLKKEKNAIKKKSLYILSDSNIILLFATETFARQFAQDANKNKELVAKIMFKNRSIFCNVRYDFFSPFLINEKKEGSGFLGFKISSIQEEDKRYLYEAIFSKRYEVIEAK